MTTAGGEARAEDPTPPRTLHFGLRVADPDRSVAFYRKLGYEVVGSVPSTSIGQLTMLKLSGDDFVTLELVQWPPGHPDGMTAADFALPPNT